MRTAICSGSFDPITLGHLDIIQRAAACFDRVCVCVSPNAEKRNQMFTPEQKLLLVRTAVADLPNVEAELWPGLLELLLRCEHLVSLFSVGADTDTDPVKAGSRPPDDIQMPQGDGVERAGANRCSHGGHSSFSRSPPRRISVRAILP